MKRITILLALLFFFSSPVNAQSVKKKALIVNNAGDTLHGWVAYKNWRKNPYTIDFFSDSLSKDGTSYQVKDIRFIDIMGYDQYVRAIVTKDNRPVKLPDLLPESQILSSTDTLWLRRLLYGGDVELYQFTDFKEHFYIHTTGGEFEELTYNVSRRGTDIYTERRYIVQLKKQLNSLQSLPAQLLHKIDKVDYREKDLREAIQQINEAKGSISWEATRKSKIELKFFSGVGGGYANVEFMGTFLPFANMNFSGGFVPFVTFGADLSASRNLQDLVFRAEVTYTSATYKGTGSRQMTGTSEPYQTTYVVQQTNISPSISLLYNFLRNENRKIYFGAGAAYNFAFYGKNRYTRTRTLFGEEVWDNYLKNPGIWLGFQAKLGYTIADKWELGLNGQFIGAFTNYTGWSLKSNTYTAQIRYFF